MYLLYVCACVYACACVDVYMCVYVYMAVRDNLLGFLFLPCGAQGFKSGIENTFTCWATFWDKTLPLNMGWSGSHYVD